MEEERRRRKKKKANAGEMKQLGSKIDPEPEAEEERHQLIENKKKLKVDIKEEPPVGVLDQNHTKHSQVAEEFGEFKEQKEKYKKKEEKQNAKLTAYKMESYHYVLEQNWVCIIIEHRGDRESTVLRVLIQCIHKRSLGVETALSRAPL